MTKTDPQLQIEVLVLELLGISESYKDLSLREIVEDVVDLAQEMDGSIIRDVQISASTVIEYLKSPNLSA